MRYLSRVLAFTPAIIFTIFFNVFLLFFAKLWIMMHETPTKLQTLPKLIFKRKICMILFNMLEFEDSYEHLEFIILNVGKYSQQLVSLSGLSYLVHFCLIYLLQPTTLTSIHYMYITVTVDLFCFQIYLIFYSSSVVFSM